MKRILISNVEPTVSNETDENGYPIWIKLKIDTSSVYTATVQLIDSSFGVD